MQRTAWTEERLDDLATSVREGFARVDGDLRDLRREFRDESRAARSDLGGRIDRLQGTMHWFGGALILGQFGLIATIIARGV